MAFYGRFSELFAIPADGTLCLTVQSGAVDLWVAESAEIGSPRCSAHRTPRGLLLIHLGGHRLLRDLQWSDAVTQPAHDVIRAPHFL